jgi:hypothetical protein
LHVVQHALDDARAVVGVRAAVGVLAAARAVAAHAAAVRAAAALAAAVRAGAALAAATRAITAAPIAAATGADETRTAEAGQNGRWEAGGRRPAGRRKGRARARARCRLSGSLVLCKAELRPEHVDQLDYARLGASGFSPPFPEFVFSEYIILAPHWPLAATAHQKAESRKCFGGLERDT